MKRKYFKISLLTAGLLALSSCDVAIAEMSNASSDAFQNANTVSVDNNTLQILYDLIREDDSFNSEIASMLTYEIAKNYLGNYTINEDGDIELENWDYTYDANGNVTETVSDETKLSFIQSHKAYWNWEDAGIRITYEDESEVTLDNLDAYDSRIDKYKELIKKQVVVTMFNNINVDTYKYNSAFYEILYVKDLMESYYSIYSVEEVDENGEPKELSYETVYQDYLELVANDYNVGDETVSEDGEFNQGIYINSAYDPEKDYNNIITGEEALIHLGHYVEYINNEVIPDILNNLLTELYILQNQYAAIGRTQQRKIEYVQITNNTANDAYNLLKNYLINTLSYANGETVNEASTTAYTITEDNLSFEEACTAWQGIPEVLEDEEEALAEQIAIDTFGEATNKWQNTQILVNEDGKNPSTLNDVEYIDGKKYNEYYYYEDSLYGDLIAEYSTLTNNPLTNNTTNYESFTSINDRTYAPEEGLAIRTNALKVEDYTTYGWGTRSDYSDLPDTITDRLFSASIINELNSVSSIEDYTVDWTYIKTFQAGGVSFLKKSSYFAWDEYDSVIWSNDDGTSYYLVAVYDYVTPSKITSSDGATTEELAEIEEYAVEVGYEIASGTTYTSVALEYFLENSFITYFDQDVFDYFVETYPDLFDY